MDTRYDNHHEAQSRRSRPEAVSSRRRYVVACLAGFLAAGMFEWNFGDEELLYLLFTLAGLAWAARRWDDAEVAGA